MPTEIPLRTMIDLDIVSALDYLVQNERTSRKALIREAMISLFQSRYDSGRLADGPWPIKKREAAHGPQAD